MDAVEIAQKNVEGKKDTTETGQESKDIVEKEFISFPDIGMVLRNMLSESLNYHKQKELLEVVAKVKITEEYKVVKGGEERFEMCKAFEDYRLEGMHEGLRQYLVQAVCKKLMKNKPAEVCQALAG